MNDYVIGVDFGSDSVRALLIDAHNGREIATSVHNYNRWSRGEYSSAAESRFRHHPLDYAEGLEAVLQEVLATVPDRNSLRAIGIDATASTPVLCDKRCRPLALYPEFSENPDAMFVLWKDHTAHAEAQEINYHLQQSKINYARNSGNYYSSECFWAKALHNLRNSPELRPYAAGVIELCDWIPAILTGTEDIGNISLGHAAAGVKMMYSQDWGGYPPKEFFDLLDKDLYPMVEHMTKHTTGSDRQAGELCDEWKRKLGLTGRVIVGAGNIDCYSGAIGAGIKEGSIVLNLGTSQCQMAVRAENEGGEQQISGIFGEYNGSILPGYEGLEAGVSAFGDLYAWFRGILAWPMLKMAEKSNNEELKREVESAIDSMIADLSNAALKIEVSDSTPLATDYINGRRTPNPRNDLHAALTGLRISTTTPEIFYAFAEASAFATRAIVDLYKENGVRVDELIGIGGIAVKSPLVMQLIADSVGQPVLVSDCKHSCALGAAISASVAAGLYPTLQEAEEMLTPAIARVYEPNPARWQLLERRYQRYLELGKFSEERL